MINEEALRSLAQDAIDAYIYFETEYDGDSEENTVLAINSLDFTPYLTSHAALVEACRELADEAEHVDHDHWNDWVQRLQARVSSARAALAGVGDD